jgi:hypothetical protein
VSEGRGLGEERLGGRRTEEREESGGAGEVAKRGRESYGEHRLGEVALGSGVDERRTGQNGDRTVAAAFKKWLGGAGQRGKKGVDVGASVWRREKEERGGGGGLAQQWAAQGGRQWPPTIERRRRHCHMNRGGWWAWATRAMG